MFSRPQIRQLMTQYTLLHLYTDTVPDKYYSPEEQKTLTAEKQRADAKANQKFQVAKFGDARLPLYVILEPLPDGTFREVDRYDEGKINSVSAYADFLRKHVGNGAKATAQANP